MQKHVNLVDLVKSFPTNIFLQNLASIQKRTSPVKFAHLAEKSGKGSISNLSTKVLVVGRRKEYVEARLSERSRLRKSGDYAAADAIEAQLGALGFKLQDMPDGTTQWKGGDVSGHE